MTNAIKRGWLVAVLIIAVCSPLYADDQATCLAVLKNPNATRKEKSDACRMLGRVGTAEAVPVLAGLLGDQEMSHMARYALEPIPDGSVDVALRDALGKVSGRPLLGVIGSIGVRKDTKAIPALAKLLSSDDEQVVSAAARSLGNIGTADCAKALQSAVQSASMPNRKPLCEGLFRCAESLQNQTQIKSALAIYDQVRALKNTPHAISTAALRGSVLLRGEDGLDLLIPALRSDNYQVFASATRISMELDGKKVTQALADELAKADADRQVQLLKTLGHRGDPAAAPAMVKLMNKGDQPVRIAAINALTRMEQVGIIGDLVKLAQSGQGELATAARESLAGFPNTAADKAVADLLDDNNAATRSFAVELAGDRRIESALPTIVKIAKADADTNTRLTAIRVLGGVAGPDQLADLLAIITSSSSDQVTRTTEQALRSVYARQENRQAYAGQLVAALGKARGASKVALVSIAGSLGGQQSLKAVLDAAGDSDEQVKQTAQKALCEWATPDALPNIVELATQPPSPTVKILALRGCYRLIPLQQTPDDKKLQQIAQVMALTDRIEEKRLAIGAMQKMPSAGSLNQLSTMLDESKLQSEVAMAALQVGKALLNSQPQAVVGVMEKIAETITDPKLKKSAQQMHDQAQKAMFDKFGYAPVGPWQQVFNGKDTSNWTHTGGGIVKVEDGLLVCTQTDGKGGNLWTADDYADFELRATYRVKWPANSGIWFRWDGKKGYQFDILKHPKPIAFSGAMYCPGKMFIINNLNESLENRDGWNDAHILAAGNQLTQWINGAMTGSVKDDQLSTGKIGLQIHPGDQFKGMQITIKSMEVRPLKKK